MKHGATSAEIDRVVEIVEEMGYSARPMPGAQRTAVGIVGNQTFAIGAAPITNLAESRLRALLVIPEAAVGHLFLEPVQRLPLGVDVKDTSAARLPGRASARGCRCRAGWRLGRLSRAWAHPMHSQASELRRVEQGIRRRRVTHGARRPGERIVRGQRPRPPVFWPTLRGWSAGRSRRSPRPVGSQAGSLARARRSSPPRVSPGPTSVAEAVLVMSSCAVTSPVSGSVQTRVAAS